MTEFTEDQKTLLAALTLAYPAGFTYGDDKKDARAVAESLVESGHLVHIELERGSGYQLAPEMAEAQRVLTARQAEQAALN